jgi:hypothetical protein
MPYIYKPGNFSEWDRVKIIVRSLYRRDDEPEWINEGDVTNIEADGFWWHEEGSDREEYTAFEEIENVILKNVWWRQQFELRGVAAGCRIELTVADNEKTKCRVLEVGEYSFELKVNGYTLSYDFDDIKEITLLSAVHPKSPFLSEFLSEGEYSNFIDMADEHETTVESILKAFVHDLLATNKSGGSDEEDRANDWFQRNCCEREFMR